MRANREPVAPLLSLESDDTLVALVTVNDDRVAFRILVDRHEGAIRSVLRRLSGGDEGLACDLAQSTFMRAYMTLDQFRGGAQLRTWLYRIACNEYFQHRRLARHQREVSLEDEMFEAHEGVASTTEQSDRSIDVERAMLALSDAEREAIVLCFYADMSHPDAAEMLGCPIGTLKSNIARGKVRLARALAAWAPAKLEAV